MVDWLQNLHFFGELNTKWNLATSRKSYSLRPLCETSFTHAKFHENQTDLKS